VTVDSDGLHRAEILLGLKRPQEAGDLAARAAAANPGDPRAWLVLARCYAMTNEPRRSLEMANRAIGLDPNDPDPHLFASRALTELGSHAVAVQAAQEVVRLAPMSAQAHANLAVALARLGPRQTFFGLFGPGHTKAARYHAQHAVMLAPNSPAGHFAAGYVAMHMHDGREARGHFRRVLAIDPQHAAALNNIAKLELGMGRFSSGGTGFARALAADPTLKVARRNVRTTILAMTFAFHALGWLIYFSFSSVASVPEPGPFAFRWSTRAEVALSLGAVYVALAVAAYLRLAQNVRAFARRMVADSWIIKAALVGDAFTALCFFVANVGYGKATGTWFLYGALGVPLAYIAIILSRSRP
jgi:tetratricopeptide (TPR) repeat protein